MSLEFLRILELRALQWLLWFIELSFWSQVIHVHAMRRGMTSVHLSCLHLENQGWPFDLDPWHLLLRSEGS